MSHRRRARAEKNDMTTVFVRVPKSLHADLKKLLAKERRRRPHDWITMPALLRRVIEQGLARSIEEVPS